MEKSTGNHVLSPPFPCSAGASIQRWLPVSPCAQGNGWNPKKEHGFRWNWDMKKKNTLGVDLDGTACTANELETNKSCKRLDCPPFCTNQTPRDCKRKLWGPVHRSEQAHQQIRSISYWSFIVITISIRDHQKHHNDEYIYIYIRWMYHIIMIIKTIIMMIIKYYKL